MRPTLNIIKDDLIQQVLAAYTPIETDALAVAEMCRLIQSGLVESDKLPDLAPLASAGVVTAVKSSSRRPRPRKEG